ncbi:GNAT family N-acetyltransferase [Streptomyces sp. NPDC054804]
MTLQTDRHGSGAPLAPHTSPLDNAVRSALTGPHAHLAKRSETGVPPAEGWGRVGRAARYPDDVYAYAALADATDPDAWADLRTLVGPGTTVKIKPVEQAPPGWKGISAVCTGPEHRGRGLATRLVRAVAARIRERGDTPFPHAAPGHANAIRLYESIGFTERLRGRTLLLRGPGTTTEPGLL